MCICQYFRGRSLGVEDGTHEMVGAPEKDILDWEQRVTSLAVDEISSSIVPYQVISGKAAGKAFVRIGCTTRTADRATIERLKLESQGLSGTTCLAPPSASIPWMPV